MFFRSLLRQNSKISRPLVYGKTAKMAAIIADPEIRETLEKKLGHEIHSVEDLFEGGFSFKELLVAATKSIFFEGQPIHYKNSVNGLKEMTQKRFYFGQRPGDYLTSYQATRAIDLTRGTTTSEGNIVNRLHAFVPHQLAQGFDGSQFDYDKRAPGQTGMQKQIAERISTTTNDGVSIKFARSASARKGRSMVFSITPSLIHPSLMVAENQAAFLRDIFVDSPDIVQDTAINPDAISEYGLEAEVSIAGVVPGFMIPFSVLLIAGLPHGKVLINPNYIDPAAVLVNPYLLEMMGKVMDSYQELHTAMPLRAMAEGSAVPNDEQNALIARHNEIQGVLQMEYQGLCQKLTCALTPEQVSTFVQSFVKVARGKPFTSYEQSYIEAYQDCESALQLKESKHSSAVHLGKQAGNPKESRVNKNKSKKR
ncbi:MAG: hypothetical protein CMF48_05740 [Legionellales bacterium]|nr:hypothetical protein [Legionellales bacterium]